MTASDDFTSPSRQERLYALLDKILGYQKSLPDARAVEREELQSQGILSPSDIEFMTECAVTYTPYRRTSRDAGDMLSMPTGSGCLSIGPTGPKPVKRTALLRDFQVAVGNFLQLPVPGKKAWGHMMHLEFTELDGLVISPKLILIVAGSPPWKNRLPAIRKAAAELGLTPRTDHEHHEVRSLAFSPFPEAGRTAEAIIAILRRGGGWDDGTEISYSAGALDELESEDSVWTGTMGSESSVSMEASHEVSFQSSSDDSFHGKTHGFIFLCIQTAKERQGHLGVHVKAHEILAVAADVARLLFGAEAASVLRAEGIDSSASLGTALYRMIEEGMLALTEDDQISDFNVRSPFDELFDGR